MSRPEFKSGFADEINKYIDFKVANGYKEKSYTILLHEFDRFCVRRGITDVSFTREDADAWSEKRETEATNLPLCQSKQDQMLYGISEANRL